MKLKVNSRFLFIGLKNWISLMLHTWICSSSPKKQINFWGGRTTTTVSAECKRSALFLQCDCHSYYFCSTLLSLFRRCLAKIGSQHPHIQIPLLPNGAVSKSAPLLSLPAALLLTVLQPGIFLTHKSKAISYNTWFTKFSSRICNDTHQILAQRQVFFAFIGFTATSSSYWIIWMGWY